MRRGDGEEEEGCSYLGMCMLRVAGAAAHYRTHTRSTIVCGSMRAWTGGWA